MKRLNIFWWYCKKYAIMTSVVCSVWSAINILVILIWATPWIYNVISQSICAVIACLNVIPAYKDKNTYMNFCVNEEKERSI